MPQPSKDRRVELVDALRGFALLGLLLIHSLEYFELYWQHPEPSQLHDLVFIAFAGKSYAIFALLFGLSFFIIMDSQARRGVDFSGRFIWRLMILLALGYLHGLLYESDVLQVLAILGFGLLLLQRFSNRTILVLSSLCVLQLPLVYHAIAALSGQTGANDPPLNWALSAQSFPVFAHGTLVDVIRFNAWRGELNKWNFLWESGRLVQIAGLFGLGLVLGRVGFFTNPDRFKRVRAHALIIATIAALIFHLAQTHVGSVPAVHAAPVFARWALNQLFDDYFSTAATVLEVLVFVELYQFAMLRAVLNPLALAGRMSLTMYVTQALVCVPLFYGFGLGLYRYVDQAQALLVGIGFFCLQLLFAHWWLNRYHYGPLEWIWRSATYMTWRVPLRRQGELAVG
ncbi:MAG: DUF418 domain-containing protein [Povalibacter sp.]